MNQAQRVARRLYRKLYVEPATRLDSTRLAMKIAMTGLDLPGSYRRTRRSLAGLARDVIGRSRAQSVDATTTTTRTQAGGQLMSGLPIVFMHQGDSTYLRYTLGQAQRSSPGSPIYLLGDEHNSHYAGVTHFPYRSFFQRAEEFTRYYRHFSTNGHDYERFSFQRWFILYEFLIDRGLGQCLYLDSDVMLFADATSEQARFADYDFSIAQMTGSVFFLNSLAALHDLGDFIMNIYTRRDRYHYDRIVGHYVARQRNKLLGGACDMNALYFYHEANYGRVGDVAAILDDSIYDLAIAAPQGCVMQNGRKLISWEDGRPYATLQRNGRRIRLNSLHCQGKEGKDMIPTFYELASPAAEVITG